MARYCVAFDSMKIFLGLKGTEGLAELVGVCLAMAYGDGCLWPHRWLLSPNVESLKMSTLESMRSVF